MVLVLFLLTLLVLCYFAPIYNILILSFSLVILMFFLKNAKHLLKNLLLLESLGLIAITFFHLNLSDSFSYLYYMFIFFTFLVAEAALGLGVLVTFSRKSGSNFMMAP